MNTSLTQDFGKRRELGRLAACYLDALATQAYPAMGYSICYEYGIFKQKLEDGWQTELPDNWLPGGSVWLDPRPELSIDIHFEGELQNTGTISITIFHMSITPRFRLFRMICMFPDTTAREFRC